MESFLNFLEIPESMKRRRRDVGMTPKMRREKLL
jgi:hypothetical protein